MVSIMHQKTPHKSYNSFHSRTPHNNNQFNRKQGKQQYNCVPSKLKCYYCKGEHIKECRKFRQDRAKYKLKIADITQKYKDKIIQEARKDISIDEATFSSNQQESTYSVEQVKQLLSNMHFSNNGSESE